MRVRRALALAALPLLLLGCTEEEPEPKMPDPSPSSGSCIEDSCDFVGDLFDDMGGGWDDDKSESAPPSGSATPVHSSLRPVDDALMRWTTPRFRRGSAI